jgi:beta-glucuronidase
MTGSRRSFFSAAAGFAAVGGGAKAAAGAMETAETRSLNGCWEFRLAGKAWRTVTVPHTWQVEADGVKHLGRAEYRKRFEVPAEWRGGVVRVEFESVFHTARVAVNGHAAGEHVGKGYTAFTLDITDLVKYGEENELLVEADNSFSSAMLPRANSYDWTPDGGIYRSVWLHATPSIYIERVEVDASPDLKTGSAEAVVRVAVCNRTGRSRKVVIETELCEEATGLAAARGTAGSEVAAGATETITLPKARITGAKLWHFDHPHLYRARCRLGAHVVEVTFGIRRIETREGGFYLNGERVRLMGVERMAGSHPQHGMAEPLSWIEHDHQDMQHLNCVFTRVHWMQDRRLLDWCDRHGMLLQVEVPTWGSATWKDMAAEPAAEILNNGLEQLREMITQNRNHPCVFSWGLCNEIGGHLPAAKKFAQALFREARRMDPGRLLSYASNTLHDHTADDVAGEMDFLEWNEYYESWFGGTPDSVRQSLKKIRDTYPGKAIVISEYGLCECDPKNPTSDERRIAILRSHDAVYRDEPNVAGLIFFCYNDYRTHMGDKGQGVLQQRVHGVVDVYGNRKASYEVLRRESSPVEALTVERSGDGFRAAVRTRRSVPAYTLRGYRLRWTVYSFGDLPMEQSETALPDLKPGAEFKDVMSFREQGVRRVVVEVVRPLGSSVSTETWKA